MTEAAAHHGDADFIFKLVVIGDLGVGKSALLRRFVDGLYDTTYTATIGVDFGTRSCTLDGKKVKLQIWDTAGSERFRAITSSYYRGAHGVIVVFDVSDRKSFERVRYWLAEAGKSAPVTARRMLVGNKCDLTGEGRSISRDEAFDLADGLGVPLVEASAKSSENVEEAFLSLARAIKASATRAIPAQSFDSYAVGTSSVGSELGAATRIRPRGICLGRGTCLLHALGRTDGGGQPREGCCA
uniref:Uncharacterized protein n=1 Tax=Alexandrium catenella TaxID=2925 RepID=A0A7S1R9U1_ALECA|mmetsp:Transcript_49700/g.133019  ORF Transcript_49700/g.133019 Transcript_49700/m.133019 type:complete len:242 (+) Transcript_49700:136-861(+)